MSSIPTLSTPPVPADIVALATPLQPDPQGRNDGRWHKVALPNKGGFIELRFARWHQGAPVFEARGQTATRLILYGMHSFREAADTAGERTRGGALHATFPVADLVPPSSPPVASPAPRWGRTLGYIGLPLQAGLLKFGRTADGRWAVATAGLLDLQNLPPDAARSERVARDGGRFGRVYLVPQAVLQKAQPAGPGQAPDVAVIKAWARAAVAAGGITGERIPRAPRDTGWVQAGKDLISGVKQRVRDAHHDVQDWQRHHRQALQAAAPAWTAVGRNLIDAGQALLGRQSWAQATARMQQRNAPTERLLAQWEGEQRANRAAVQSRTPAQRAAGRVLERGTEALGQAAMVVLTRRTPSRPGTPATQPERGTWPRPPQVRPPVPKASSTLGEPLRPPLRRIHPAREAFDKVLQPVLRTRGLQKDSPRWADAMRRVNALVDQLPSQRFEQLTNMERLALIQRALAGLPPAPTPIRPASTDRPTPPTQAPQARPIPPAPKGLPSVPTAPTAGPVPRTQASPSAETLGFKPVPRRLTLSPGPFLQEGTAQPGPVSQWRGLPVWSEARLPAVQLSLQTPSEPDPTPLPALDDAEWALLARLGDFDDVAEAKEDIRQEYQERLARSGHPQAVADMGFDPTQLDLLATRLTLKLGASTLQRAVDEHLDSVAEREEALLRLAVGDEKLRELQDHDSVAEQEDALLLPAVSDEKQQELLEQDRDPEQERRVVPWRTRLRLHMQNQQTVQLTQLMEEKLPHIPVQLMYATRVGQLSPKRQRLLTQLLQSGPRVSMAELAQAMGVTQQSAETRMRRINATLGFNVRAALHEAHNFRVEQRLKEALPLKYHARIDAATARLKPGQRAVIEEMLRVGPQVADNAYVQKAFALSYEATQFYFFEINRLFDFNLRQVLTQHLSPPLPPRAQAALERTFPPDQLPLIERRINQVSPATRRATLTLLAAPPLSTVAELIPHFGKDDMGTRKLLKRLDDALGFSLRDALIAGRSRALAREVGQRLTPALGTRAQEVLLQAPFDLASWRVIEALLALDPATGDPNAIALPPGSRRKHIQNIYTDLEAQLGFDLWAALQANRGARPR